MGRASASKWIINSKIALVTLLISVFSIEAQTLTSSNLPIVIISTDKNPNTNQPLEIRDNTRVGASMKIIKRPDGSRNFYTDRTTTEFLNYDGRINIEIRGSSSQGLPKKPYGLTTLESDNVSNNNVSLLGMPKENDWILNALAFDPSLLRDYLSYNLSRQMGNYAPRTVFCEVIINNEYRGLYLLQEKIKVDSNRVDIVKMETTDNTLPNVTGGYITKADKTTGGDPVAWTMPSYSWSPEFIHDLPKPEEVTSQQNTYIKGQFFSLASTSNANNTSYINGFPSVIDVPTFIDFMISNELASNADGYQFSTYFHKDRNGKLRAGPIWDFNLTYNNDLPGWDVRSKSDIWQFSDRANEGAKFWTDLFNNPTYKCYMSKRWNTLIQNGQPLNYSRITEFIDETVNTISEAAIREHQKWGTLSEFSMELTKLKSFLSTRISWITSNLGSFSACNSVAVPSLVITKINYNPATSSNFTESNDLEFIEIKNTGNTTVNLTGIYFRELGVTYNFPANSTLMANKSIFLASNSTVFTSKYGFAPFGQFTRNLSNSSEKLVLADGFGNVIDTVEYFDKSPWPDADGSGNYLQLISTALDNNVASSWIASSGESLSTTSFSNATRLSIYPNPARNSITIDSDTMIKSIKILNVLGAVIYKSQPKSNKVTVDIESYTSGVYMISVDDAFGATTKKFIKQ
jgi:hypothetical protein